MNKKILTIVAALAVMTTSSFCDYSTNKNTPTGAKAINAKKILSEENDAKVYTSGLRVMSFFPGGIIR